MLRLEAFQNMLLVKTDVLLVRFWYLLRHVKITLHVDENLKNRHQKFSMKVRMRFTRYFIES